MELNATAKKLLKLLEEHGPLDGHRWAELACLSYRTLYSGRTPYLKLFKDNSLIHVCEWRSQEGQQGMPIPIFALGKGENVPKPEPLTRKEKKAKYRNNFNKWRRKKRLLDKLKSRSMIRILLKT